ncbi:ArnT family glycosyltransferase [Pseudoxanthomonas composti]|uniref:Glycosyltransferase family 39 protein n=1 Tax=Pseudoxanthomonas composti TaxID=2137479 RepID=A0A4Q1JRQ2_9GAMM|nr:glycosyltransferase family 39 protein [Pseudoxanthomonas composti]RXR00914.1 glycosyltransferase family 39 protein [Pseudoxanthomonas composti]
MQEEKRAARCFIVLWAVATAVKLVIAARLPLFVDEAFYWQEGRHLAAAYSDLPGLTAWLIRLGTELGGQHVIAARMPFLLMAAALPWMVKRVTARLFDAQAGWLAASLTLLMPLSGSLGLLALPDVAMAFAAMLCLEAIARMLRAVDAASVLLLAAGLSLGALSHYRFVGVIGVGFLALLCMPQGRLLLRDPRVWIALAIGLAAWSPLLAWNLQNADAGLRFQLVERHPWQFQWRGLAFLPAQLLLVTPVLAAAMIQAVTRLRRDDPHHPAAWRALALMGAFSTLGYGVLGFFADVDRVSFHWPLQGYLALLVLVPWAMRGWTPAWRGMLWGLCGLGLLGVLGYYLVLSSAGLRERLAASKYYPYNFAGWHALADAVEDELGRMPPGTRILADDFKVGAELGFALDDPRIAVLDHPLNRKHGRAPQLRLWSLEQGDGGGAPALLVIAPGDVQYKSLLQRYHWLCERLGPLPAPRVVHVDHGQQRFLLFRLPPKRMQGPCTLPGMAWVDAPASGARVASSFQVSGWAFKDGVGLAGVDVLLDGQVMTRAQYGVPTPKVAEFWKDSSDPQQPNVGFTARVDARGLEPGQHWLGLRLHGRDGSVEDWPETPVLIGP